MARLLLYFMFFIVAATATDFSTCPGVITTPGTYTQVASFTAGIAPCFSIAQGVKGVTITQPANKPFVINAPKGQRIIESWGSPGTSAADYGITLSNIQISVWDVAGAYYNQAVFLWGCNWCSLTNVTTAGAGGAVLVYDSTHFTAANNSLSGYLTLSKVSNSTASNNQIFIPFGTVAWTGLDCSECNSVTINGNWIDGAWYDTSAPGSDAGMLIMRSANVVIANNRVHHVQLSAYEFAHSSNTNISFTGNSAWSTGSYCFAFAHAISLLGYFTSYGNACYGMRTPNGGQTAMLMVANDTGASATYYAPCGSTLHMDNFVWHDNSYIRPDNNPSGSYLFYVSWQPNSCYTSFVGSMQFAGESWGHPTSADAAYFKSASGVSGTNMSCNLAWYSDSQVPFACQ